MTSILKLDYGVTTNKIVCAILNARKELMQMESVKAAEVMLFEITATALVEKREPGEERKKPSTLFIINFRIINNLKFIHITCRHIKIHRNIFIINTIIFIDN